MLKQVQAFTRQAAFTESTKSAHMLHWKTYAKFCLYFGLWTTTANPETICIFAQLLAGSFKAPQSIVNYVASLKLGHSLLDFVSVQFIGVYWSNEDSGILTHIAKQAASVTSEVLVMCRQHLDISDPILWALFLITFLNMAHKS